MRFCRESSSKTSTAPNVSVSALETMAATSLCFCEKVLPQSPLNPSRTVDNPRSSGRFSLFIGNDCTNSFGICCRFDQMGISSAKTPTSKDMWFTRRSSHYITQNQTLQWKAFGLSRIGCFQERGEVQNRSYARLWKLQRYKRTFSSGHYRRVKDISPLLRHGQLRRKQPVPIPLC